MQPASNTRGSRGRLAALLLPLALGGALWFYFIPRYGAAAPAALTTDHANPTASKLAQAEALPDAETDRVAISSDATDPAAEEPARLFGDVVITVKARDGHTPVAGAEIWTVPSHSEVLTTDRDGRVSFHAESSTMLAGVESAHGYLLWDPLREVDGTPGEPGSALKQEVAITPGSTTEIGLFVRLGATIRGTLVSAEGTPLPRTDFYMAAANGSEWLLGTRQRTDDNGEFRIAGLRPNWYLLGPDPFTFDVFTYEHIRADWGSTHEATLQLMATHDVPIEVVPEGVGESDTWPLPLYYRILRNDRMEIKVTRLRHDYPEWRRSRELSGPATRGTVSLTRALCEGPYLLQVVSTGRPPMNSSDAQWLGTGWRRSLPFAVDAQGQATFLNASPANRAVLEGMDRIAYLRVAVTGARSVIWIQADGGDTQELLHYRPPSEDENGRRFLHAAVDLSQLGTDRLVFREKVKGEPPRPLETVTLAPGENEITLILLGPQEGED